MQPLSCALIHCRKNTFGWPLPRCPRGVFDVSALRMLNRSSAASMRADFTSWTKGSAHEDRRAVGALYDSWGKRTMADQSTTASSR